MKNLTEAQLIERLGKRFKAPEFSFLSKVRNGTGWSRETRTADALAMGLWPSRGLHLHGFEIKSARSDWMREKNDPAKADLIAQYCDFWWLVAGANDVVKIDEVPMSWGLLIPSGAKLKMAREPKLLESPKEITRKFLAAILRRAVTESPSENALEAARQAARDEENKNIDERLNAAKLSASGEYRQLKSTVERFEKSSGVSIADHWNAEEIGGAVKILVDGDVTRMSDHCSRFASQTAYLLKEINQAAKALKKLAEGKGENTNADV